MREYYSEQKKQFDIRSQLLKATKVIPANAENAEVQQGDNVPVYARATWQLPEGYVSFRDNACDSRTSLLARISRCCCGSMRDMALSTVSNSSGRGQSRSWTWSAVTVRTNLPRCTKPPLTVTLAAANCCWVLARISKYFLMFLKLFWICSFFFFFFLSFFFWSFPSASQRVGCFFARIYATGCGCNGEQRRDVWLLAFLWC
jgi:hypothetical protein